MFANLEQIFCLQKEIISDLKKSLKADNFANATATTANALLETFARCVCFFTSAIMLFYIRK